MHWNNNNLYGSVMIQKLPFSAFKWTENAFWFDEDVVDNFDKDSHIRYTFLKLIVNVQEDYKNYTMIYHVYLERCNL